MAMAVFGKEQELATIARLLDERRDGPGGVLIEGEAGIGKTTLWEAALERARARAWRVLAARPAQAEGRLSYGAAPALLGPVLDETIRGLARPPPPGVGAAV